VVQFNKQDLPGALSPDTLRNLLGSNGAKCFPAVATQGIGVLDTLKAIIGQLVSGLQ
jgi:signal recognition particle receptor subunit beta